MNINFSGNHPYKSQKAKKIYLSVNEQESKMWPVSSKNIMVDTAYGKTFVRISGPETAPPLVLLHGISGSSLDWIPNIETLSKYFRTYAVDNIYGFGLSIYTKHINSSDDFVNWLDQLFNGLDLSNNINLLGVSYGAWQAALYAKKSPQRLASAILAAPIAVIAPVSPGFILRMLLSMIPLDFIFKYFMRWLWKDFMIKDQDSAEKMINIYLMGGKCFTPRRPPNPTLFTDDELRSISVPVLYIVGENEKNCSIDKALQRINNVAPGIKTELIPNAGHDLLLVQPETINNIIVNYLIHR